MHIPAFYGFLRDDLVVFPSTNVTFEIINSMQSVGNNGKFFMLWMTELIFTKKDA